MPPLKQKGKIPVQETTTPESKPKSKFTRIPREKEPEPEVVKLKKVPMKAPKPEVQVVTHQAEVTRHYDDELTVHRLHHRKDKEIITLARTSRVFTAEEETIQVGHLEEAKIIQDAQEPEKEGWTRTPKPQTEEEPGVPTVDKKKITKLPVADEQQESVKLKPFGKSPKLEEEPEKLKLKPVPAKPREQEKEVVSHKVEVTKHYDGELTVQRLRDRDDREVIQVQRTERVFTAAEDVSELGRMEKPELQEPEEEKSKWTRTPKGQKEDEPEPDLTKKKVKKLPKKDEDQEVVTLKPFEKPKKQEEGEPPKAQKEAQAKTDTERTPFKRGDVPLKDRPTAASKDKKDADAPMTTPDVTPATPDVSTTSQEIPQKKKDDRVPKDEEPVVPDKLKGERKGIPTLDKKKEHVDLKPVSKTPKAPEEEKKKPVDAKVPSRSPRDEISPKDLKEEPPKKVEKSATPKRDDEKLQEKETSAVPAKKPSPADQKDKIPGKEVEKVLPQKPTDALKKGAEPRKTLSPRAGKEETEEEKPMKHLEQLKKVELKKTPSPKTDKPKEPEKIPVEKKPSADKVKRIPTVKAVSPKDSIESVTLKKLPRKPSAEEPSEPAAGQIPLEKEISPRDVQMKRVTTQPEEEVFEEEFEGDEDNEDVEAWGWDLVPTEDWEGEVEEGALETPGMPGARRGELGARELSQWMVLEPSHLR